MMMSVEYDPETNYHPFFGDDIVEHPEEDAEEEEEDELYDKNAKNPKY